jgi:predicted nucleotidyltransferase
MAALATPLDTVLASKGKLRLLRIFVSTTGPLSGREAGRRAGLAKRTADVALRDLSAQGLIVRENATAQALFRINPVSVLASTALVPLFAAEQQWADALYEALRELVSDAATREHAEIIWAGLYGSVARGDADSASDLDLAVITRTSAQSQAVQDAISENLLFVARFGRALSPLVLSLGQLKRLAAARDSIVKALVRDGRRLIGTREIAEVARGRT